MTLYKLGGFVLAVLVIVILIVLLVVATPLWRWGLWAVIMLAVLFLAGKYGTSFGWSGALVDPQRGKYSLGQLQLVAWTILVLSAWVGIVLTRIVLQVPDGEKVQAGIQDVLKVQTSLENVSFELQEESDDQKKGELKDQQDELNAQLEEEKREVLAVLNADVTYDQALNVDIPGEVLILLGISASSLVAGAAIKSEQGKEDKPQGRVATLDNENAAARDPKVPKWTDILKGDQDGDKAYIDIGKFQMFWFTVGALFAYGMQIYAAINLAATSETLKMVGLEGNDLLKAGFALFDSLPAVSASLAGVLGISHVAYLANKVPPREEKPVEKKVVIASHEVGIVDANDVFHTVANDVIPLAQASDVGVRVETRDKVANTAVADAKVSLEVWRRGTEDVHEVSIVTSADGKGHAKVPATLEEAKNWRSTVTGVKAPGDPTPKHEPREIDTKRFIVGQSS